MTDGTLDAKHAVVTGAGSGVGAATAHMLAEAGAAVTVVGRRRDPLDQVAASHERIAVAVADVTDRDRLGAELAAARTRFGPIDAMVCAAGISSAKPFHQLSPDDLHEIMSVNLVGVFNSFQIGLADMRRQGWGRLIAIASTAGLTGYPYVSQYCASKHAVVGMTRALAHETGRIGVTVNAICPSYVDTPMTDRTIDNIVAQTDRSRDEALAALTAANPQGRLIHPTEVAGTALWLCSDAAAGISGQAISIDGGEL